jgi:hypothetical protein
MPGPSPERHLGQFPERRETPGALLRTTQWQNTEKRWVSVTSLTFGP